LRNCYTKDNEDGNPMVSFRGTCYDICPDFTRPKSEYEYEKYECDFHRLEEAENLEELRDFVIIQVREL
jgi:hypothetical protein